MFLFLFGINYKLDKYRFFIRQQQQNYLLSSIFILEHIYFCFITILINDYIRYVIYNEKLLLNI